jgi:XTP/dITP diphosphohydrolase
MRTLLVATTNKGKFKEIAAFLKVMPFKVISLDDLDNEFEEPEEPFDSLTYNSLEKAKYYAEKSGHLSLADDGGLFIDELDGWPGVRSARTGKTDDERMEAVLEKMKGIPQEKRSATFRLSLALHDPTSKQSYVTTGECAGDILETPYDGESKGFGYDPIFLCTETSKTFAEMGPKGKNSVSHRARALQKMEYVLKKNFGARNIVVPCGLLIQDGKLLLQRRNDPGRPAYHRKWEFPGGGVEFGDNIESTLIREVKEEVGYDIEIIKKLQYTHVTQQSFKSGFRYQVYVIPHLCKIVGGDGVHHDQEVIETDWFDLDNLPEDEWVGENKILFSKNSDELKQLIADVC